MALEGGHDNPDPHFAGHLRLYRRHRSTGAGAGLYDYSVVALQNLASLVSYAIVLWTLSAGVTLPGLALSFPGICSGSRWSTRAWEPR